MKVAGQISLRAMSAAMASLFESPSQEKEDLRLERKEKDERRLLHSIIT